MGDDNLIVKIGADVSEANAGIKSVGDSVTSAAASAKAASNATEGLFAFEGLEKLGEIAKEAFSVLVEQVKGAVEAYAETEAASRMLTGALQNQGVYTDELKQKYDEYAASVSAATGIDQAQISVAQATIQSLIGQIPVTEELTQAIADLSVQQGISLPAAANELGKAISQGTGQLLRQGLQFAATDTEADRYQKTLDFVTVKAGGMAEAANTGLGSIKGLQNAFHESQVELGERFAPAITFVITQLTNFLTPAEESNGALTDLKASLIVAGLALTGIATALPILSQAFLAVKAAVSVFNLELTATKVALAGLGIGLIIVLITELALNWESVSARVIQVVKGMVEFVSGAFQGLSTVISGAFHLDPAKIKEGLDQIQTAFAAGAKTATAEIPKATEEALQEQDQVKKKYADKAQAERASQDSIRRQLAKAEQEAQKLQLEDGYQDEIELKKKEIEVLKQLEKSKDAELNAILRQRLAQIRAQETTAFNENEKRGEAEEKVELNAQKKLAALSIKNRQDLSVQQQKQLSQQVETEEDVLRKAYADELQLEIKAHNQFLEEQNKYGTAYATINQAMHSSEVQGFAQATQNLAQLQNSKNAELKAIGKAAAAANIVIQTAQSAMSIFTGFSAIPIVGPALGIAGAAAAILYGAEKEQEVLAAATGGLVEGGIPGRDSVRAMLEPGELVVPKQNFQQVVGAVQNQKAGGGANYDDSKVIAALQSIDGHVQKIPGGGQQTVINGDVLSDRNFVDALIRKINVAVQYRNAKLVTSTASTAGSAT